MAQEFDDIPPSLFLDYCEKVDVLTERERKRMERYCNFCGALTDEGCELCVREDRDENSAAACLV